MERKAGRHRFAVLRVSVIALCAVTALLGTTGFARQPVTGGSSSLMASEARSASPRLPPLTIAACNAGLGDMRISTFVSRQFGLISLRCGDARSGYVHIRTRHQKDWQRVVDMAGGGGNWDDLMEFVTRQSIEAPSPGYPREIRDGKLCFTTPAMILSRSGLVIRVLSPTVITSRDNRKVITSIPTTGSPSCR